MFIIKSYYISENLKMALNDTGLSLDELKIIVGRFRGNSIRKGLFRGEVIFDLEGNISIRHHFHKKILWTKD